MTNSSQSLDAAAIDVVRAGSLYNPDLAPVPWDRRRWGLASFAALWVSRLVCWIRARVFYLYWPAKGGAQEVTSESERERRQRRQRTEVAATVRQHC
jgi:hypothetical protein